MAASLNPSSAGAIASVLRDRATAGDLVVFPELAYPTYEDGARLAGATVVRTDSLTSVGPTSRVRLVWVNSPGNPTGAVMPTASEYFR